MTWIVTLLVLIVVLAVVALLFRPILQRKLNLYLDQHRHRLADKGKLLCQDDKCNLTATFYTPNGYFCNWHYEPMSIMRTINGRIRWAHPLHHSIDFHDEGKAS